MLRGGRNGPRQLSGKRQQCDVHTCQYRSHSDPVRVDPALPRGVCLCNFPHLAVNADGNRLHVSCHLLVLRPPAAFSSCFYLTAVATAIASVTPSSHMLFRRIQREGLMLKGLSTAGRFMPAAGPSQATAITWRAPKAAPAAMTFHGILRSFLVVRGGCNLVFVA
jgi:hypothetical protein